MNMKLVSALNYIFKLDLPPLAGLGVVLSTAVKTADSSENLSILILAARGPSGGIRDLTQICYDHGDI